MRSSTGSVVGHKDRTAPHPRRSSWTATGWDNKTRSPELTTDRGHLTHADTGCHHKPIGPPTTSS